jgi:hypothetical protein
MGNKTTNLIYLDLIKNFSGGIFVKKILFFCLAMSCVLLQANGQSVTKHTKVKVAFEKYVQRACCVNHTKATKTATFELNTSAPFFSNSIFPNKKAFSGLILLFFCTAFL